MRDRDRLYSVEKKRAKQLGQKPYSVIVVTQTKILFSAIRLSAISSHIPASNEGRIVSTPRAAIILSSCFVNGISSRVMNGASFIKSSFRS
jgi:hypothetical protein